MDFASLLGSEIKKRKTNTTSSTSTASIPDAAPPPKKYLRRSDVEAARKAEYLAEQARLDRERAEKAEKKRQAELEEEARQEALREKKKRLAEESRRRREEEEARRFPGKNGGVKDGETQEPEGAGQGTPEEEIPEEEVTARLRRLGHPVKLFGETPVQRLRRLKKLERGAAGGDDSPSSSTPNGTSRTNTPKARQPPPLTESEMQLTLTDVASNPAKVYTQLHAWFRLVLLEWDLALAARPLAVHTSYAGKAATNAFTQASTYMAPLFKHLEKQDLHPDIFPKVCEIVYHAQQRRYVTANDVYLRLSIGNAAWPIGVTMVGIHERSAREKLHEKGMAAHIMSDEVTRKYLQSIKRCLKFCQTRWPPEDQLQLMG